VQIVIDSTADRRIKKYFESDPPFWVVAYDCTSLKLTDRNVGRYLDGGGRAVINRVAHDFSTLSVHPSVTPHKVECEVQVLNPATYGASVFEIRSRTHLIDSACNALFFRGCGSGTLYASDDGWNIAGWKGKYDLGAYAVDHIWTDLVNGDPFQIAIRYNLDNGSLELVGLYQQDSGSRITLTYVRKDNYAHAGI